MPQPAAEITLTAEQVAQLVREQHPSFAGPIGTVSHGWDNDVFRLGDRWAVRAPRRRPAVALIENEQRWLPEIAERMPVAVPAPVATGIPGALFPWPWSIVPWFDGVSAAGVSASGRDRLAPAVAAGVVALHTDAPADAPVNAFRGVALRKRADAVEPRLTGSPELMAQWRDGCAAPEWPGAPVWVHGDLHVGNLICRGGELRAIIDFGDLTSGDPACDLAVAWLAFTTDGRAVFRAELQGRYDPHIWRRARAWAVAIASLVADADDASLREMSAHAVAQLLTDTAD
ncbi:MULTISPECIES: aminoglycoside phosphotransferase family protein [unclassified Microbacterium]|uniref:aminoglycoside phosphotransferase family protein n=1 Tax=unclassified Microbacterium TaxID=2609290 RepID=UPI00386AB36B